MNNTIKCHITSMEMDDDGFWVYGFETPDGRTFLLPTHEALMPNREYGIVIETYDTEREDYAAGGDWSDEDGQQLEEELAEALLEQEEDNDE